jgi:hypothetical protein
MTHNGKDKNYLWGVPLGPARLTSWKKDWVREKDRSVQICTACHNPDGPAAAKIPQTALHPQEDGYMQLEVKTLMANPKYPYMDYVYKGIKRKLGLLNIRDGAVPKVALFDEQGMPSSKGNITCMTCHDPHNRIIREETPEKKWEGTVADSSLKENIASRFCSDCHEIGSIYNFAFYHENRNRPDKPSHKKANNPHWKKKMSGASCVSAKCHQKSIHGGLHSMDADISNIKEGLKISKELPLVKGKIDCITCHNPELQTKEYRFLRKKNPFFIRGIYESLLKRTKGKEKIKEGIIGGPPKIAGLMAGPGSIGTRGGPEGAKAEQKRKTKKKAKKKAKKKKMSHLLKVRWERYQVCYYCHIKDEYRRFSPHQNQLDAKGSVNDQVCLICHTKVPNREKINEANFFLVRPLKSMCRKCHRGYETEHPAQKDHFSKKVEKDLGKKARTAMGSMATFIPLDKNKLVCPSCHNPHAPNVIQVPMAAKGSGDSARLRLSGQMRCGICHGSGKRAPEEGVHYSPF